MDWSDASEARQAAELVAQWAPIGVADALELLSPDFVNEEVRPAGGAAARCKARCLRTAMPAAPRRGQWPGYTHGGKLLAVCQLEFANPAVPSASPVPWPQVRGHAVEVLQNTDDDELLYYLLQLVQVGRRAAPPLSTLLCMLLVGSPCRARAPCSDVGVHTLSRGKASRPCPAGAAL